MAKKKRSKRKSIRDMDFFAGGEPLYGMDGPHSSTEDDDYDFDEDDDFRTAGPRESDGVRRHGDPDLADMLSRALTFSGRLERHTHGFHTYPAGMHPNCAAEIIAACPGAVHDPFCGGGTVMVEAMLAGQESSGADISPIAALVSRARTAPSAIATPIRAAARRVTEQAKEPIELAIPEDAVSWYEPHVAQEIARLNAGILMEDPSVQPYLFAVLSAILIKTSFRESDTSNRRVPNQRPPETTLTLFHKKAREYGRMLEEMPEGMPRPIIERGDARTTPPPRTVDLILTSPPYPGVYDYLPMQQLRFAWLKMRPGRDYTRELGSRRDFRAQGRTDALKSWTRATQEWIRTQSQALNPGGHMAIVVGDGLVGDRMVDALNPTVEAMESAGLTIVARASADRPDYARESVRVEHLILGERS
ncbi:MAG: hypothetical protein AAFV53_04430 [Myxococcota bacterium]